MVESRLSYERRTKDPQTYAKTYASNADHMSTSDFMGADRPSALFQASGHARKLKPAPDAPNSLGGCRVLKTCLASRLGHRKPIHEYQMCHLLGRTGAQAQQLGQGGELDVRHARPGA